MNSSNSDVDRAELGLQDIPDTRPLAIVTGASTGIGFQLARCCAASGMDLIVVADEPQIQDAAANLGASGVTVESLVADLSTRAGVDELLASVRGRRYPRRLPHIGTTPPASSHWRLGAIYATRRRILQSVIANTVARPGRICCQRR